MDKEKANTTNYSQRNLGNNFNIPDSDINKNFDTEEKDNQQKAILQKNLDFRKDEINLNIRPHQRTIEEIVMGMREVFFKILEMLIDKENPIPYIFSSEYRQFDFTLFLIIIGSLLLLFSNIMK
jgi:hypothetical protein